jgi:hypothetical protein
MIEDEAGRATTAGLVVFDDAGRYFLIPWDDLLRFRVPEAYRDAVAVLVLGDEAPVGEVNLYGAASKNPAGAAAALLEEVVTAGIAARGRLAARRLTAWALLR